MRMMIPGLRSRRTVDRLLSLSFRHHRLDAFRRAIAALSRFYLLPCPQVEWFEYLDWGKTAGRTYENGRIHLVHPENWKRGRKYKSERQWIHTVYHEMGHYVLWADAERKADCFAYQFVRGIGCGDRSAALSTYRPSERSIARRKRGGPARRAGARRSRPRRHRRRSRSR
jgi:hypothetical protein